MSSIIEGYNYDIFISYRQKDNKGDMWVSEFVEALKTELESTFKEEISVYFDINSHDGLLETHDVDESLKEKLKCLIFIPIISRTYCDPKCFAWEHEFKAFVEQASEDKLGLKVKLTNGNVTNRVLPVLIHDLDNEDNLLCESVLGSVLRGIKFIYKEPGVNRPLTSDDNEKDNLNKTRYRNQINKVANAIKEVIQGLWTGSVAAEDLKTEQEEIFDDLEVEERRLDHKSPLILTKVKWGKLIPWSVTGIVVLLAIIFWIFKSNDVHKPLPINKYVLNLPSDETLGIDGRGSSVAFSPDGTMIIYVSMRNDTNYLYLKMMDEFEGKPIPGTENASAPFLSPDGKWVAFFANGMLKRVSILGGGLQTICEARSGLEGCWGKDNDIIYADNIKRCLMRVQATGGMPEQITSALKYSINEAEHSHYWPQILPGGKLILFTILNNTENMSIVAFSLVTGERWNLIPSGSNAFYIQTGYLVYAWNGDLMVVPFNLKKMNIIGEPKVVQRGIRMNGSGLAQYSISDDGSLAYIPGEMMESEPILVLVDRNGESESLNISIPVSQSPRFSPDGKQILFVGYEGQSYLYIYEIGREILRRFTEPEYETYWAIWTPDGKQIVFNSNMHGGNAVTLHQGNVDGTGSTYSLVNSNYHQQPKCWSNDNKLLIYTEGITANTGMDIWQVQTNGDTTPKPLFNTRFNEIHPTLSPDGHWLAYVTDETGQEEVFVCSFPSLGNKKKISTNGGVEPLWSPNRKELYYRDATGDKVMVVPYETKSELDPGIPRLLFQGKFAGCSGPWGRNYDITPNGERFLMIEEGETKSDATQINVVLNWPEELKQLVPKGNRNR